MRDDPAVRLVSMLAVIFFTAGVAVLGSGATPAGLFLLAAFSGDGSTQFIALAVLVTGLAATWAYRRVRAERDRRRAALEAQRIALIARCLPRRQRTDPNFARRYGTGKNSSRFVRG